MIRRWWIVLAMLAGCSLNPDRVSGLRPVSPGAPDFESTFGRPVLRWETFPTEDTPESVRERVRNVVYDLRVLDDDWNTVYSREGIKSPEHRLGVELSSRGAYHWSVRARFTIAGRPRVTQWTEVPPYRARRADGEDPLPLGIPVFIP